MKKLPIIINIVGDTVIIIFNDCGEKYHHIQRTIHNIFHETAIKYGIEEKYE